MPGPLDRFPERRLIVGMNSLDEFFDWGRTIPWIKTQNAVAFLRPMPDLGAEIPGPTTCVAESLRLRQVRFTAPEGFLGSLALFDVNTCAVPLDDFSCFVAQRYVALEEPAVF